MPQGSVSLQPFLVMWIFPRFLSITFYDRWNSQWGSQKLLQGLVSHWLSLPFWFLHLLWLNQRATSSKVHKLDNFESNNFLKLSCTNVPGRRSNFLGCECFFGSNSPDMLALCETNLDGWIASTYFSFTIFFSLIWMDSRSHMHGLSIYVKERLPFCMKLVL